MKEISKKRAEFHLKNGPKATAAPQQANGAAAAEAAIVAIDSHDQMAEPAAVTPPGGR